MHVIFQRSHKFLPTLAKDDEGDNDAENGGDDDAKKKNVLDTGMKLLRPFAIAQMMPQIFWSIVSHCRLFSELDPNIEGYYLSVEDTLQKLLPNLDWSYLNRDERK